MPIADTKTVVKLLREYAQRTALRGGNPYRAKAYSRAADSLAGLAEPLDRLIAGKAAHRNSRRWRSHRRHRHQAASYGYPSQSGKAPPGDPSRGP